MSITIGLPFWNNERTLGAAIRSVLAQTVADWRLLLVNDGSRDASAALVGVSTIRASAWLTTENAAAWCTG